MDEVTSDQFAAATQNSALSAVDFATQQTLQLIESVTERRPNLRFLEVGCGKGHLAEALVDKGHQVLPIDVSEEAVAFARSLGLPAKQTDIFGVNGITAFHRIDIENAFAHLMNHYSEHGIHTGEELIRALRNGFRKVEISEGGPYLYRYFVAKMESAAEGGDFGVADLARSRSSSYEQR